jgi:hypothetical protein
LNTSVNIDKYYILIYSCFIMKRKIVLEEGGKRKAWIDVDEDSDNLMLTVKTSDGEFSGILHKYEYRERIPGAKNYLGEDCRRGVIGIYEEGMPFPWPHGQCGSLNFKCDEGNLNYTFSIVVGRGEGRKDVARIETNKGLEDLSIPFRDAAERQSDWDKLYM